MSASVRISAFVAAFLIVALTAAPAAAQGAAPPTRTDAPRPGFYAGARIGGAALATVRDSEVRTGGTSGVLAGYWVTPNIGLELGGNGGRIAAPGSGGAVVGHTDLLLRYRFSRADRPWFAFAHAGPTWRTTETPLGARAGGKGELRTQAGLSLGGGFGYRLSPTIALETAFTHTAGRLGGSECPSAAQGQRNCVVSSRLSFGFAWQPDARR